jgi:hypothetical protein
MNAICLITLTPNKIWCDFLNLFKKYKIFIIVDDNNFDLTSFINTYNNITFIKVENEKCTLHGYIDANFFINKLISGWDKALYYFNTEENNYDFIWFVEDDVFFYNEDTIIQIDSKYINDDLLSNCYLENTNGETHYWHWNKINIQYPPPYYNGMMCVVRVSKKMIDCINDYAYKNKTLFFLEALFPTISIKNNLKYSSPSEFYNIHFRYDFKINDIDTNNLYHPVKDLNDHISFRQCQ